MLRPLAFLAALLVLALAPSKADAQRFRNGTVKTPYGQFSASEMRAAGGNPLVAGDLREQRMALQSQQRQMRQQQLLMRQASKQRKARQDSLKKHPEEAAKSAAKSSTPASMPAKGKANAATNKAAKPRTAGKVPGAPTSSTGIE